MARRNGLDCVVKEKDGSRALLLWRRTDTDEPEFRGAKNLLVHYLLM